MMIHMWSRLSSLPVVSPAHFSAGSIMKFKNPGLKSGA